MRDSRIIAMQHASGKRDGLILAQFEFLKTRQEAFEAVLNACTLRDRLRWLFFPEAFMAAVDATQQLLLEQAKRDMAAAQRKTKLEVPIGG